MKVELDSGVLNQWDDDQVCVREHRVLFNDMDLLKSHLHKHVFVEVYHETNKGDL